MTLITFLGYQGLWAFVIGVLTGMAGGMLWEQTKPWSRILVALGVIFVLIALGLWYSTVWIDFTTLNESR